jgi:glycosyltransferase involved in cell wall biosynthesis
LNTPGVSVVMCVFNGAQALAATLDSVLGQQNCDFEFIVVNDGSTDASASLLDQRAARDRRLRVIHQANTGLTRALIRGCEEARGDFIARQDCGDISLPGRLSRQHRYLHEHADAAMVACAVRFVGPADETLFVSTRVGRELDEGLARLNALHVKGPPHHGATMFRRSAYLRSGGYRSCFVVAQDLDLWLRLREFGACVGEAEIGYQARLEAGSISASRRADQLRLAALAVECARRRHEGLDERDLLASAATTPGRPVARSARLERAKFFYFIGSCLRNTDPTAAKRYYWQAFREHPLLLKSLVRFALG